MTIVGIDCATLASKTGLAFAEYVDGRLEVRECIIADARIPIAEQVVRWLKPTATALLALDSPLGWPALLGTTLAGHKAGIAIYVKSNELFRRHTDEVVRATLGKSPLEVGADRIARTAIAALSLLADVGVLIGKNIALAWEAQINEGIRAIEVYPAGTLRAYQQIGFAPNSGNADQDKQSLIAKMRKNGRLHFDRGNSKSIDNEHALDSVLCALAATDFIEKRVIFPGTDKERELARKEGWIWVRDPAAKD
jgi:predicted nuclease with RNAse H fold